MEKLIFILGLPRSGTTLLQRILSTSPEVATAPEPWLFLPFLGFREARHYKAIYGARQAVMAMDDFLGRDDSLERGIALAIRQYLGNRYTEQRYFCEKTPRNLLYAERLRDWLPDERYIVLNRNPLNVAASIFRTFESGVLNPYKFRVDLELGLRQLVALNRNPEGALVVRYEDLVGDPGKVLVECRDYLGLADSLDAGMELPQIKGRMGDPTGQFPAGKITARPELAYLGFIDSVYRKRWFSRYLKSIGHEAFSTLGYDYDAHRGALHRHKPGKPVSIRDLVFLAGRKFLEFTAFRILPRRPEERPDYLLY
jgi:hypothetical protein